MAWWHTHQWPPLPERRVDVRVDRVRTINQRNGRDSVLESLNYRRERTIFSWTSSNRHGKDHWQVRLTLQTESAHQCVSAILVGHEEYFSGLKWPKGWTTICSAHGTWHENPTILNAWYSDTYWTTFFNTYSTCSSGVCKPIMANVSSFFLFLLVYTHTHVLMMYLTRIVYLERIPFRLGLEDESKKNVEKHKVSLQHLPDRTHSLEISSYRCLVVHPVVGIGVKDQNAVSSFVRQLHCRLHWSNNDAGIANQSSRPWTQAVSKIWRYALTAWKTKK